ncbi:MAG: tRNA (5-methylaminomethyl-2-thiouridine)(34)-methyltransferase MnmD [Boseongicola sp.]|nr:tRNA (5-methylaminomethyl-2-thiouridine)(34)-methyltransferase MnmD [Boseongicola sp.]
MPDDQHPDLEWQGDVPVASRFGDPYFSLEDGLAEARHVFLAGNGLPDRFVPGFHVAELGFGTGLNALAAWAMWRESGVTGSLRFTSFELFPMAPADMSRALSAFPEIAGLAAPLVAALESAARGFVAEGLHLKIVLGDARETLACWDDAADAWFLDGFSPARNPELWTPDLLRHVARHTRPGGTAATYSAARAVRAGLADAGFAVERVSGFGRKRHMTVARS